MKLSPARQEILSIVKKSGRPLPAREIKASLADEGVNLSTVYRGLDFLEKSDFVRSIPLGGARYYYSSREDGHGHFLVCRECREIIDFDECVVESLQGTLQEKYGYEITGHAIFFEGLCSECRKWKNRKLKNEGERDVQN